MSGFNWWLVAPAQTMGVDNANASPINVSALPATTRMVQWREGRGEIELTTGPPLRTTFTDPTPYASFFQQFLTLLTPSGLTLAQAQKVQNDLVDCIYDSKRQLPFSFNVAAAPGTEIWSASDEDVLAMCNEVVPQLASGSSSGFGTITTQINGVIVQINTNVVSPTNTNNANIVNGVNGNVVGGVNSNVVGPGNTHAGVTNTVRNSIDASIVPTLLGALAQTTSVVTVSGSGVSSSHSPANVASPGLTSLPGTGAGSAPSMSNVSGVSGVSGLASISSISGVGAAANIPWSPIDATAPLLVTMTEITGIMSGIASRRQTLLNTRYTKRAAINALSTIAAVIAYDVTSGW
jgi:hypothetical protein